MPLVLRLLRLFLVLSVAMCPDHALADTGSIKVDVPVRPELSKHADLLASPSYLLVALDNIRQTPLTGSRIMIIDGRRLRYRIAEGGFVERKGAIYRYEGKVEWDLAVTKAAISVVLELDTGKLAQGEASISVEFPFTGLVPQELIERVRAKFALAADLQRQDALLVYLGELQKRLDESPAPKSTLVELILVDAHNKSMAMGTEVRQPGDAEPLSDQVLLTVTLIIWLVAVPAGLAWRRRLIARAMRKT